MRYQAITSIVAIVLCGIAHAELNHTHWMAPANEAKRSNPVAPSAVSIARGKKIFEANCVSCHGESGQGDGRLSQLLNPKPANLQVMAGNHTGGDIAWKIANGRGPMPAWKEKLSAAQIWDVVNYVQGLDKKRVGPVTQPAPSSTAKSGRKLR